MKSLTSFCRQFISNQEGLETVEYAIIGGLIAASTLAVIGTIGVWIGFRFETLRTILAG